MADIRYQHELLHLQTTGTDHDHYRADIRTFVKDWLSGRDSFLLHTSGSTGTPRPIQASRSQMEASARATISFLKIAPHTPVTVCIDARFVGGKMQLVRALLHELPLQIFSPAARLAKELEHCESLGLISLVPLQLYHLLEENPQLLNKATAVLVGGASVHDNAISLLQQIDSPVYQTYGMTETLSHIALRLLNGRLRSDAYEALPGIELATDPRGCLVVKGEVTRHERVVTNDLVDLVGEKKFFWKGRIDDVVNSGGIKIFPDEIDRQISQCVHSYFPGCLYFTSGIPDDRLGQKLVLFIETESQLSRTDPLREDLKLLLLPHHAPREVVLVNKFFTTESGKVDKRKTVSSAL